MYTQTIEINCNLQNGENISLHISHKSVKSTWFAFAAIITPYLLMRIQVTHRHWDE